MYKQVQKSNSSFSPASIQKKSNNSYSSPAFSVQRKSEINPTPQPKTPSYSRNAANLLAANFMQYVAQSEPK